MLVAAALTPLAEADRIEPAVVDRLVEDAQETKPNRWGLDAQAYASVFADPRLDDTDFGLAVDEVAADLVSSLRNDDLWND